MNLKLKNKRFLKITELYAFIAVGKDGEGIMGAMMKDGTMMPLIGADIERVDSIKEIADLIAEKTKTPYEIRYFKQDI